MKLVARLNFIIPFLLFAIVTCAQSSFPKYEFRAVWIASVDNIDWPSKKGLPVDEQKAEFIRILDMHRATGMNAVIVQVRPAADAFYPSTLEPWSEFLNGRQGLPPTPFYDPLQFMIEETHKRGMEFHAWINPYRAVFNVGKSSVSPSHISKIRRDWTVTYGRYKWLDPGIPEVRQHTARVVRDIVSRYDIDAIHMDDYFYPYKDAGKDFPDARTYARYGNGMDKADWRRSNVDSIIKLLNETIKAANPRVKFGISPFGIWRNKKQDPLGSNTNGSSNYDDLYANVLLWLQQGWIDYVAPQLYWYIGHRLADYTELLDWWSRNTYGKHLYIGHAYYRAGESGWKDKQEIPNQLQMLRENKEAKGSIYFSSKTFDKNPFGWNDSLKNNFYFQPAIIPSMPWIDAQPPVRPLIDNPKISFDGEHLKLAFKNKTKDVRNYVIYYSTTDSHFSLQDVNYLYAIIPAAVIEQTIINFPASHKGKNRYLKVTVIDVNNNESEPEELLLFK
jgi:uncharacterized lipoprotein YddW (UPF0748 family)